jgi:hypothetical protein
MKMTLSIYIACGLLLFSACEKSLPYNSEGFTPKLVINSFNSSDSLMKIGVSLSTSTLKTPSMYELAGKCKVLLLKDNLLLLSDSLELAKGEIILPFKAVPGSIYELQLSHSDFPSIKAIDSVPLEIPELYIDTLLKNAVYYTFKVRVKDFSTLQKYQFQTLIHGKEFIDSDSIETTYSLPFSSTDKIFISTIRTVAGENTFALFGDELWNGQERNIDLRILKNDILKPNFTPNYVEIILSNLSLNMYTYYASLLQNNHVYGGPLSSVTDLNGNIDQGLGGFYFYTQNVQRLDL